MKDFLKSDNDNVGGTSDDDMKIQRESNGN